MQDRVVIRELARRYAEIAALPHQQETIDGWRRLNGLQQTRPMVRIDQLPWEELPWGEDQMVNRGGMAERIERRLRMTLYAWDNFKADMVMLPYYGISKTVRNDRLGPDAEVERQGLSQHFAEQLA
ncbi:MAG: hypothetical protein ACNA71_09615, partial [Kiritimatiellia bacterium]